MYRRRPARRTAAVSRKLLSGTWVSVGNLRTALVSAAGGLLSDAVICGHDRDVVTALAWPAAATCGDGGRGVTGSMRLAEVSVARGGRTVVREVSLEVPAGAVTALLGANGAGKSSLVLGIAGVLPLSDGHVALDGERILQRC